VIIVSWPSQAGERKTADAERERLKIFQDRGMLGGEDRSWVLRRDNGGPKDFKLPNNLRRLMWCGRPAREIYEVSSLVNLLVE
jgi:hypothetical protein